MTARVSPQMLEAIELIKAGATRYQAAKKTGLTISAITRSRLYKEYVENQKGGGSDARS